LVPPTIAPQFSLTFHMFSGMAYLLQEILQIN
jgi:hypothetical protein